MKMKKLVSAIAALAMSVSAFAGIASAATTVHNLTTAESLVALTDFAVVASDTTWVTPTGLANRASTTGTLPSTVTGDVVQIKFDTKHSAFGGGVDILDSNGNQIIDTYFANSGAWAFTVNGVTVPDFSRGNTVSVDITVDMTTKTIVASNIAVNGTTKDVALVGTSIVNTAASDVAQVRMVPRDGNYNACGNVSLSNLVINTLAAPAFTLAADTANASVGSTATIDVTNVVGDITVASANPAIATGSYADGVLTVNGVAEGVTTLTVTATSEGLTKTADITVVVGDIASASVVINYYLTGTTDAVPTLASVTLDKAVGDVVEADVITTADVVTDTDKYVYNSVSVEFPYTVVDGENVINVYYTQLDKYTGNIVTSTGVVLKSFTDVIAGDTVTYSNSMYLTDANGKVTAKADGKVFTTTVAPTADGDITVPYTAYEGVAYFAEGENMNKNATQDSANYSGGSSRRASDAGATAFTVAEAGTYKITVVGACRNTGKNSVFSVYKNSVEDANLVFNGDFIGASYNSVQEDGVISTESDVTLAAGDVIILAGDSGNSWIDYILVEKTGDVVVEPTSIDGTIAWVAEFTGDAYEGEATALTATFDVPEDTTYESVTVAMADGSASVTKTAEDGITIVTGGQVVYGIVVNSIVTADALTAVAQ